MPPRNRATSSSGRCVADRPMRCRLGASSGRMASSRSSDSARCAPRFVGTSAWISSMMTVSTARNASRALEVRSRYSDSGVVIRMSAGSRWNFARSAAGVSPVLTAMTGALCRSPRAAARFAIPASGARRFRSMSTASALSGETYNTRHWRSAPLRTPLVSFDAGSNMSRLMHQRNAVSVFPLPVGARISVDSPRAMAGQPCTCGGVGASNESRNQSATAGWNRSSTAAGEGIPLF